MSISISVKGEFAAGHRILGLEGEGAKCSTPHGHNFQVVWQFAAPEDVFPPPVEFGEVKRILKLLIRDRFDHAFFVHHADHFYDWLTEHDHKIVPMDGPPTTERMVSLIAAMTQKLLPTAELLRVDLHEGPVNTAIWTRD